MDADPGFVRSTWFSWLFTTGQGVAYSAPRGDANVFVLIFGWGAFIYAGMVALYLLACALWSIDDETGEAVPGERTSLREPKADT
ncbi:hypothetical protein ACIF80_34945 [Streptomyces sp. NPDC085927]|uniref:hypothetical protein n=1 Tax=Streptomyces sp. NPDC085927 TaxID=3365738 RepID=UPI0037D40962